jgi:hypothetical protein
LNASPISLPYGSSVVVSIQAQNAFGISTAAIGNGAILINYPGIPLAFNQTMSLTSNTSITL